MNIGSELILLGHALHLDGLECSVELLLLPPRHCGVGDARSAPPIDKETPRLVAYFSLNDDLLLSRIRLLRPR
jgi:hypothetical protein